MPNYTPDNMRDRVINLITEMAKDMLKGAYEKFLLKPGALEWEMLEGAMFIHQQWDYVRQHCPDAVHSVISGALGNWPDRLMQALGHGNTVGDALEKMRQAHCE